MNNHRAISTRYNIAVLTAFMSLAVQVPAQAQTVEPKVWAEIYSKLQKNTDSQIEQNIGQLPTDLNSQITAQTSTVSVPALSYGLPDAADMQKGLLPGN